MNFSTERENNIIKNIAKEIVIECSQSGFEVSQELANRMVKLKLLNPKNGFTASEVMPRSLTQQLVMLVVEDLKQDTPAMNCIRMQVYWDTVKMNVADLKKEYFALSAERMEPHLTEILVLEREDFSKIVRILATCILCGHNLGNQTHVIDVKETMAAIHSVFKYRDMTTFHAFHDLNNEQKTEKIKTIAKTVTGIRLYLKYLGKAGEGVHEVNDLPNTIEALKKEIAAYDAKLSSKIEDIRETISSVIPTEYIITEVTEAHQYVENLPPECDENDFKYLKKILAIMLQHRIYLSDISSKLEEIDGDTNFFLQELNEILQRLQATIRDRDAVPTTEVYDDFMKASDIWTEIQSYSFCFTTVEEIVRKLETINKKEHFAQSRLEKALSVRTRLIEKGSSKTRIQKQKSKDESSALLLKESEDFHIEFNGYCAWTLYCVEGMLVPGDKESGLFQYEDQYFAFSSKSAHELWARDPQQCLMVIYEYLRNNSELVYLLNAYENLYNIKSQFLVKKVDRKIAIRKESIQTDLHPIEEYWDKDYTFSIWELKKRALALSRLVKCETKSVQTISPHSHNRASIGVLAAPDKSKEVQTKKDSYCNHPTISSYLYGLRGHREDKFRVIDLTRPIDETFERQIILKEKDCRRERQERQILEAIRCREPPCPSAVTSEEGSDYFVDSHYLNKFGEEY